MTGSAHDEVQGCLGLAGNELQVGDRLNPPCQTDHHEAGAQWTIRVEYRRFDQGFDPAVADYRPQLPIAGPSAWLALIDVSDGTAAAMLSGLPRSRLYTRMLEAAGCPAQNVLFVGDIPTKDVIEPRRHGMQADLIAADDEDAAQVPADVPIIGSFADVPDLIAGRAR